MSEFIELKLTALPEMSDEREEVDKIVLAAVAAAIAKDSPAANKRPETARSFYDNYLKVLLSVEPEAGKKRKRSSNGVAPAGGGS